MEYLNYERTYKNIISQYKRNTINIKNHRIYEYLWALEKKVILWDDIPPWFEDYYDLPHLNDYGVDLVSLTYDWAGQAKFYGEKSMITWSDACKFSTYTKEILEINKMGLLTTPEAHMDSMVKRLLKNCNMVLTNVDFQLTAFFSRFDAQCSKTTQQKALAGHKVF